jgi:arginine/ornithine transport system permease protein
MNLQAIFAALPTYLAGAGLTLQLLVAALLLGGAAALPLAVARGAASRWVHGPVWAFTYVIRGTPLLVQLFLLYYGLAQFEAVRSSALWPWLRSPAFCALAAFAINTCAYTTEILHGTLRAVPAGEVEAARALGMSPLTTLRRIVLPSALRRALPAYGNEVVLMLHGTALASVVTLHEADRRRARIQLGALPALRSLHHRGRVLRPDHGRPGGPVPRRPSGAG